MVSVGAAIQGTGEKRGEGEGARGRYTFSKLNLTIPYIEYFLRYIRVKMNSSLFTYS